IAALKDTHWDVRLAAATALWQIADAAAVPALIAVLKDTEGRVRLAAVTALHAISERKGVRILPDGRVEQIE
ncbi:MAG: HEAT repeat domain-containing protein, partial [Deltaproteobacteria bacterium]|nr:HEAT repeat domain-containing protein [Deltaproteobacteria bacterium]